MESKRVGKLVEIKSSDVASSESARLYKTFNCRLLKKALTQLRHLDLGCVNLPIPAKPFWARILLHK